MRVDVLVFSTKVTVLCVSLFPGRDQTSTVASHSSPPLRATKSSTSNRACVPKPNLPHLSPNRPSTPSRCRHRLPPTGVSNLPRPPSSIARAATPTRRRVLSNSKSLAARRVVRRNTRAMPLLRRPQPHPQVTTRCRMLVQLPRTCSRSRVSRSFVVSRRLRLVCFEKLKPCAVVSSLSCLFSVFS